MGPPYYSGEIIPTPRDAAYRDDVLQIADGPGGKWRCVVEFAIADGPRELLQRLLSKRLEGYTKQFPALAGTQPQGEARVLFGLANDESVAGELVRLGLAERAAELPAQGYLLDIRPDGVVCAGVDEPGVVNGLASLLQLIHVRDGKLVARCATIHDWPTFQIRYTSEYWLPGEAFFDWMMLYKINGFAACYPGMRWEGLTDAKRKGLRRIGEYIDKYGTMNFLVEFHIGGRGGRAVDCGNEDDIKLLLATIEETMELSHPQHVMICYDDVTPELQPEEKEQFERPAQAHGALMERVYEHVKSIDPDTVVSFCSPNYQGRRHPRWRDTNPRLKETLQYMRDLKAWENRDIRIVWTGPVTESRSIVQEDIDHYLRLIGEDRKLFYWDNTWHYHQPMRNFHAKYLEGFEGYCADSTSYINVNGVQPIGRFFAATANDYYWGPEGFDSVRARRHAVAQFMGPDALGPAEAFYKLRGDDYFVFFSRDVDLDELKTALTSLTDAGLDEGLNKMCWAVYNGIVKGRTKEK